MAIIDEVPDILIDKLRAFFFACDRDITLATGRKLVLASGDTVDNDHGNLNGLLDNDHTQYPLKSVLTAKGSIYAASAASTPAERTVGTNGQLLSANSAQATGMEWIDSSAVGHIIQEEGVGLAAEPNLNFVGSFVTASDDAGNSATKVEVLEDTQTANTVLAGPASGAAAKPTFRALGDADGIVPIGGIIMWSGSIASIPANWALCDGTGGTPNLQDRFVIGAGSTYAVGATGGAATVDIEHAHGPGDLGTDSDSHTHGPGTLETDSDSHTHGPGTLNVGTQDPGPSRNDGAGANSVSEVAHTHSNLSGSTASDNHNHNVTTGVTASDNHNHLVTTGTTANAGSTTLDILNPFYALAYIMRTT